MAGTPKYPCSPILLPDARGVMCPNNPCYGRKTWNPAKGERPHCIMCATAFHEMENSADRPTGAR